MTDAATDTILQCKDISSGYDDAVVIRNVSLSISAGQVYAVLGKNGMGKTTLLKTIMGFLSASAGGIFLLGNDVTTWPPEEIARRGVAYVPQEAAIFQDLTVEENLRLALTSDRHLKHGMEKIAEYFSVLPERRRQKAGTLSGGEQKMLLMGRALMADPKLMLIDEISEGLQPTMVERMAEVLRKITSNDGATVLLVEQNVRFVDRVADVAALIKIGRIEVERQLGPGKGDEAVLLQMMQM